MNKTHAAMARRMEDAALSTTFSVAVFAHNEALKLAETIRSILAAGQGMRIEIAILANGCSDNTVFVARQLASLSSNIQVAEIDLADKANAWNHYVHEISASESRRDAALHIFVDGDIRVGAASFQAFSDALAEYPSVNAIGALPASGRDKVAWTRRMISNGTLAGGLYVLNGPFVERIRQRGIRIPRGLIGEDWAVSLFAQTDLMPLRNSTPSNSRIIFALDARFSFRSLDFLHLKDYRTYFRRLWRYALRGVQYEMLLGVLLTRFPEELPADVNQLYVLGIPPSRLKWAGITSILRFIAVQRIRGLRKASSRRHRLSAP